MEAWHFIATAFGVVFTTLGGTFGLMKLTDTRTSRLEERIDRLQDKVDAATASLGETRESVAYMRGRMTDNVPADPRYPEREVSQ